MTTYKTKNQFGYSILGEKPPKLDMETEYYIINESSYFPNCVIIQRVDNQQFGNEKTWVVPRVSMY